MGPKISLGQFVAIARDHKKVFILFESVILLLVISSEEINISKIGKWLYNYGISQQ